eukprot:11657332-Alexandrium_andersonii.AAC.1
MLHAVRKRPQRPRPKTRGTHETHGPHVTWVARKAWQGECATCHPALAMMQSIKRCASTHERPDFKTCMHMP